MSSLRACFHPILSAPATAGRNCGSIRIGRQLDDNAHMLLRFSTGACGALWASQVAVGANNGLRLRVYGETAGLGGAPVYVCENPNIVAIAADQLGSRCAPLVCTEGMPAAAQRTLLTQLTDAGARLLYHGDFDWAGLRIANFVMRIWPALPWRFRAADYEAAVSRAPHTLRDLGNAPVAASWDDSLTAAMQSRGLAIAEEAVVAALLEDLALSR